MKTIQTITLFVAGLLFALFTGACGSDEPQDVYEALTAYTYVCDPLQVHMSSNSFNRMVYRAKVDNAAPWNMLPIYTFHEAQVEDINDPNETNLSCNTEHDCGPIWTCVPVTEFGVNNEDLFYCLSYAESWLERFCPVFESEGWFNWR